MPEHRGLLLREDDHLPCTAREARERPVEARARALPCCPAFVALDQLMHALMAQAEAFRDLAQRASLRMKAPDRVAVVGPGTLQLVLGLEHAVPGVACLAKAGGVERRHARLWYDSAGSCQEK